MLAIVARSASAERGQAVAGELDELADDAVRAQHLADDEHEVGRGAAARQLAVEAHADDLRQRLVERLAEQHGLRLDAADAVAQDAEAVDHRRVRVGARRACPGRPPDAPSASSRTRDDRREVLEVDLVDDAGARRHDAEVAERGLRPAQQLVALAVALVLAVDVEGERVGRAEAVDLDGVVDDEVGRHERVDARRVAAERGHRVAHRGEVHDRGHAGEVLEEHARGHERDLAPRPRGAGRQAASAATSRLAATARGAAWRSTFSSRTLTVKGRRSRSVAPAASSR